MPGLKTTSRQTLGKLRFCFEVHEETMHFVPRVRNWLLVLKNNSPRASDNLWFCFEIHLETMHFAPMCEICCPASEQLPARRLKSFSFLCNSLGNYAFCFKCEIGCPSSKKAYRQTSGNLWLCLETPYWERCLLLPRCEIGCPA